MCVCLISYVIQSIFHTEFCDNGLSLYISVIPRKSLSNCNYEFLTIWNLCQSRKSKHDSKNAFVFLITLGAWLIFSKLFVQSKLILINTFWHYFRIKQEWNFILECRKKGIPQSKYLKNGFVDIDEKILDMCEKAPQLQKRITLSDETNKETNKFIFQLSGEQWMVNIMANMLLLLRSLSSLTL